MKTLCGDASSELSSHAKCTLMQEKKGQMKKSGQQLLRKQDGDIEIGRVEETPHTHTHTHTHRERQRDEKRGFKKKRNCNSDTEYVEGKTHTRCVFCASCVATQMSDCIQHGTCYDP